MTDTFDIVIPTLFGLEACAAREIRKLGYETSSVEDGRITFSGGFKAVCDANMWLRTGDRVLIKIGEFTALTFDDLFEKCKMLPWADWLDSDSAFPVKGFSIKSGLFSVSDIQSIIKKSIVDSLSQHYHINWFPENGSNVQIQFSIIRDKVTLMIDTTGISLHKRGYRVQSNAAPVRETIAAAMVDLSYWRPSMPLADPFCGSGTIPIEAAMAALNIAPGINRSFAGESLPFIPRKLWDDVRTHARATVISDRQFEISGSDIDSRAVELALQNCKNAMVDKTVRITRGDVKDFTHPSPNGVIICNPPYGERLGDEREAQLAYKSLGRAYKSLDNWSLYALTSYPDFERYFGKTANKKRKLYNGMLRCDLYQYFRVRGS